MLDKYLRRWFVYHHGEGEAHQADVYRCYTCHRLITWNKIRKADVCCQGRVVPAVPTWFETAKLLVTPWLV